MHRLREVSAAFLVALVVTAAVLPLAATHSERRGCHCHVKMACCEDGTCMMGRDEPPATKPEWRGCQRETPTSAATPLDTFDRALTTKSDAESPRYGSRIADASIARPRPGAPNLATPPPRLFSF